jgi:dUTP diphosphatase
MNIPWEWEDPVLRVKKLSENAKIPTRGSPKSAGYDLYASEACVIPASGKALVKTDISVEIPIGYYGRIASRSSLAWKHHLSIGAGVIDEDYRGPIGIIIFNHTNEDLQVIKGDRLAQMILTKIITPKVVEVDNLDDTQRGAGGFGSTGTN